MPINFELNFVQPLLLDIQNGNIPDADTFSAKVAEYYERTVLQGMPQAIPVTLPAPALQGAPGTISTGTDNYIKPASTNSSAKMYRNIARYYVNRELILGEQDAASSIDTLEGIIRKQNYNIKRIQVFVNQAKKITRQLAEIPAKAQNLKLLAQDIIADYKNLLVAVRAEIQSEDFGDRVQQAAGESAPNLFKEELAIIDTITNLKFDSIPNVVRAVNVIANYNRRLARVSNSTREQQKALVTARITVSLRRIQEAASAFAEPTAFGPFLARLTSDKAEVQSRIEQARLTYLEIKQIEETLRPALVELERKIAEEKKNLDTLIKNKIKDIKERIAEKQAANAEKRLQKQALMPPKVPKPSPLVDLFKQKKEDVKTFRKNNEENVKILRRKQKIVSKIIAESSSLINAAYALQDTIINVEVPLIANKLNQATGSLQEVFSEGGRLDQAITQASASIAANEGKVYGSIVTPVDPGYQLKKFATTSEEKFIRRYFKEQGLTAVAEPFVLIATQSKKSFQDFRVFVEQTDKKYDQYAEVVLAFRPRLKRIVDDIKRLDDEKMFIEPVDMDSQSRNERYRAHLEKQQEKIDRQTADANVDAALRAIGLEPKPKFTIIAILKEIAEFVQFIYSWVIKTIKKIKKYIKKQIDNAIRIKKQIEEAVIASLPIPTASADIETRAQAAKEKKETIKQYKQKVLNYRKKGEAIALVSQATGPLLNNIASGKLRASANEKWIKQIGLGKFKYNTVGLEMKSAQYLKEQAEKEAFDDNVNSLRIIETYVDLILTVYRDIEDSKGKAKELINTTTNEASQFGLGFIEDIKQAALQAANSKVQRRPDGTIGVVADLASNQIISIVVSMFEGEPKFDSILNKLKRIRTELKGKVLTSLLQSVNFTQSLVSVEQKYLFATQATIRKLVGRIEPTDIEEEEKEAEEQVAQNVIRKTDEEIRRRAKQQADAARARLKKLNIKGFNFYDEMIKLDKLINKRQGSFLAALIDRLLYAVNDFEQRIRKQVKEWLKKTKAELKERIQEAAKEHSDKLDKIKAKLANADAIVQTAVLGLSARAFWTGVTWQNTVGTTFQVISIGQFPRLRSNGLTDGGEAVIREIASNFEKQLKGMQGIYIPNPALGIPLQTFKGYA